MAYNKTIVCLANSFKPPRRRCLAGREVLSSGYGCWIRPVSDRAPAEVSPSECQAICHIDYVHLPELAPTAGILDPYKKAKNGDWDLYERQFLELMRSRHIEDTPREILDGGCLLCSEETPHHCHRRLVAEYLKERWQDVQIEHIA